MKCVRTWCVVPYGGGWKFKHPVTGVLIQGRNRGMLMAEAKHHADSNNIPWGATSEREVEQWLCEQEYNRDECMECKSTAPVNLNYISFGDVVRGTTVMAAHVAAGRAVVSQDEANRRAALCAACPLNVKVSLPCGGLCGQLKDLVDKVVGTREVSAGVDLRSCAICHCYISAAVWLPLEVQCLGVTDEQKKLFADMGSKCWKQC